MRLPRFKVKVLKDLPILLQASSGIIHVNLVFMVLKQSF